MRLLTNGGESFLSHPHMLRHACGFALADQGADTRLIQDCLGNRGATLPFMSEIGKAAWFRPFAVDFGTEAIDAGRERSQAQMRGTAGLLNRAGSALFGPGLGADARNPMTNQTGPVTHVDVRHWQP